MTGASSRVTSRHPGRGAIDIPSEEPGTTSLGSSRRWLQLGLPGAPLSGSGAAYVSTRFQDRATSGRYTPGGYPASSPRSRGRAAARAERAGLTTGTGRDGGGRTHHRDVCSRRRRTYRSSAHQRRRHPMRWPGSAPSSTPNNGICPSAASAPSTSTSLRKPATRRGGKLTTATTSRPTSTVGSG